MFFHLSIDIELIGHATKIDYKNIKITRFKKCKYTPKYNTNNNLNVYLRTRLYKLVKFVTESIKFISITFHINH